MAYLFKKTLVCRRDFNLSLNHMNPKMTQSFVNNYWKKMDGCAFIIYSSVGWSVRL